MLKHFGLQPLSTWISPRQTVLVQNSDTRARSPTWAKKSSAEAYGGKVGAKPVSYALSCLHPTQTQPEQATEMMFSLNLTPSQQLCL